VLQPELTDPLLKGAYQRCVADAHTRYAKLIAETESTLLVLLEHQTTHLTAPTTAELEMALDWSAQLQKVKSVPARFEKVPEVTLALTAGGAALGKAAGVAVGSKLVAGSIGGKVAVRCSFSPAEWCTIRCDTHAIQ
jgi:hypothetical protein